MAVTKKRVSYRLDFRVSEFLNVRAESTGISQAGIIERAVREYADRHATAAEREIFTKKPVDYQTEES